MTSCWVCGNQVALVGGCCSACNDGPRRTARYRAALDRAVRLHRAAPSKLTVIVLEAATGLLARVRGGWRS